MFVSAVVVCAFLSHASGKQVPLYTINPTGRYDSENGQVCRANFKDDESRIISNEVTACFWIAPYRSYGDNLVMLILDERDEPFLIIGLDDEDVFASAKKCKISIRKKLVFREWNFACVIVHSEFGIVLNGEASAVNCERPVSSGHKSLVLGTLDPLKAAMSGLLADVRIYWRALTLLEINKIAKYDVLNYNFFTIRPDIANSSVECNIDISLITSDELLADYIPYVISYFPVPKSYEDAVYLCKCYGGRLPANREDVLRTMPSLIFEYVYNTGLPLSRFWVEKNSEDDSICLKGVYRSNNREIIPTEVSCERTQFSFFCLFDKNKPFHFSHLTLITELELFYPIKNQFHVYGTNTHYLIQLIGAKLELSETGAPFVLTTLDLFTMRDIVGRRHWTNALAGGETTFLTTFGVCDHSEFTCSDGFCIDSSLICNLIRNCRDGSDEANCNPGIKPSDTYNKYMAPFKDQKKTPVKLSLLLNRVVGINMDDHIIELSLHLEAKWKDFRLMFKNLRNNKLAPITQETGDTYWRPMIRLPEAIHADKHKFDLSKISNKILVETKHKGTLSVHESYEAMLFQGDEVTIKQISVEVVKIICKIDVVYYPFDKQVCVFRLEITGHILNDAKWDVGNSTVKLSETLSLQLYDHPKFTISLNEEENVAIFTFSVWRKFEGFAFTTFFPCVILEFIGLLTHVFPIDDYQDRVTVTLSCLIVMAALFTQLSNILPASAEPKVIDIWMSVHVAVLFFIFINHIAVIYTHNKISKKEEEECKMNRNQHTFCSPKSMHSTAWTGIAVGRKHRKMDKKINKIGFIINSLVYFTFLLFSSYYVGVLLNR